MPIYSLKYAFFKNLFHSKSRHNHGKHCLYDKMGVRFGFSDSDPKTKKVYVAR